MGILSKILPLAALGVAIMFIGNIFGRPAQASLGASALGETGSAIGSTLSNIGGGAEDLGSGVGSGLVGLFKPFWEIKNLMDVVPVVYDSTVAGAANSSAVAQISGETVNNVNRPSSSTITWSSGTTRSVPTLSAAAKSFYAARGVSVT